MIQAITFINRFGRPLRCVLREPELSHFAIRKVTGLGPGAATVNIHDIVTADGGYFGSARFEARTIEFEFVFTEFDGSGKYVPIEQTRLLSYEFFSPKSKIKIVVETDIRALEIEGYVERSEPDIFSKDEGIVVSVRCPEYYFKMISADGVQSISTIYGDGLFKFPFNNNSLTKKLIKFGELTADEKTELLYDGDAENGFVITIHFTGASVSTISIKNTPLGNSEKGPIGFENPSVAKMERYKWTDDDIREKFIAFTISKIANKLSGRLSGSVTADGNRIVINTNVGKKSVVLIDARGTSYNITDAMDHLEWLRLYPGYNEFEITCNTGGAGHFTIEVSYESLFTGV